MEVAWITGALSPVAALEARLFWPWRHWRTCEGCLHICPLTRVLAGGGEGTCLKKALLLPSLCLPVLLLSCGVRQAGVGSPGRPVLQPLQGRQEGETFTTEGVKWMPIGARVGRGVARWDIGPKVSSLTRHLFEGPSQSLVQSHSPPTPLPSLVSGPWVRCSPLFRHLLMACLTPSTHPLAHTACLILVPHGAMPVH